MTSPRKILLDCDTGLGDLNARRMTVASCRSSDAHILFTLPCLIVSGAGKCGSGWLPPSSVSSLHVRTALASHWPPNPWLLIGPLLCLTWMGVELRPGQGGFADNVKTAAFFVCDFYKIWWATIYTWITFKTVRESDQALNWLDV